MSENGTVNCESCGMPLNAAADHGAGDPANPYCTFCTEPDGRLQSFDVRFEAMVGWSMRKDGLDRATAEAATKAYMAKMPAWRDHFAAGA